MSGKGMGGKAYDDFIEGYQNHPKGPSVMVCSQESMRELEDQFGSNTKLSAAGTGYVGTCLGIHVWIDNRFDQPLLLSGLE